MPPRRHSADLRGRRQDLGSAVRDMAAGLGIGPTARGICSWGVRARASGSHKLRRSAHVRLLSRLKCEIVTYEKDVDGPIIASWSWRLAPRLWLLRKFVQIVRGNDSHTRHSNASGLSL